jgi:hypothetical protein
MPSITAIQQPWAASTLHHNGCSTGASTGFWATSTSLLGLRGSVLVSGPQLTTSVVPDGLNVRRADVVPVHMPTCHVVVVHLQAAERVVFVRQALSSPAVSIVRVSLLLAFFCSIYMETCVRHHFTYMQLHQICFVFAK